MRLDEFLGERQAQAQRAFAGRLDPRLGKTIKGPCDGFAVHTLTVVRHHDPRPRRIAIGMEQDPPALRRLFDGMAQKMLDRLLHAAAVAGDPAERAMHLDREVQLAPSRDRPDRIGGGAGDAGQFDILARDPSIGLVTRQVEHIVDQQPQPLGGFEDRLDIAGRRLRQRPGETAMQHLGKPLIEVSGVRNS